MNECFTSHIKELRREESQYLLQFLFDYQARAGDLSARVKWEGKQDLGCQIWLIGL